MQIKNKNNTCLLGEINFASVQNRSYKLRTGSTENQTIEQTISKMLAVIHCIISTF